MRSLGMALVLTFVLVIPSSPPLGAQVWDNGTPDGSGGLEATHWRSADRFILSDPTTVHSFRAWAFGVGETTGYLGTLQWELFSDNGGAPGSSILAGSESSRSYYGFIGYYYQWQHDLPVPSLFLNPGTYWLTLHNGPWATTTGDPYYWATSSRTEPIYIDEAPFGPNDWEIYNFSGTPQLRNMAFQVFGEQSVVPEPSTVILLATGLLGIGFVAWRRKEEED